MDDLEHLEQKLNKQITDEFKGVLEYDGLIEAMPKEHIKHVETLRRIQKEQATHLLELVNIAIDMGFPEPKIIQQLEEFFKIKEY